MCSRERVSREGESRVGCFGGCRATECVRVVCCVLACVCVCVCACVYLCVCGACLLALLSVCCVFYVIHILMYVCTLIFLCAPFHSDQGGQGREA
jgi:hypothetical protein